MQNKCLRIIFNAPRFTRNSQLHEVANLPYMEELIEHRVKEMYKHILTHENPLIQTVGLYSQQHAKFRSIFQGIQQKDTGIT